MIHFGREVTGSLESVLRREWLVTNGIGGYAMGAVGGARTRRYHGLLVASLQPPTRRTLIVGNLDTWIEINGRRSPLVTHEWAAGVVLPDGYRHLESFTLDGLTPTLNWSLGDVKLTQRIWMAHQQNTTYVTYTYARGTANIRLILKPLCTYRDHHKVTKGGFRVEVNGVTSPWPDGQALAVQVYPERAHGPARPFRIVANRGTLDLRPEWWWSFHLAREEDRGLDDQEDLFAAGTLVAELQPGDTLALVFTADATDPAPWQDAYTAERQRQERLLARADVEDAPDWVRQLVLAADQFIVTRDIEGELGTSILAGYPWFTDWGRDAMIALPGLTLVTGRHEDGARILRTFARYVDEGMLPNRFPDADDTPEYNTVDAALWYFQAIYAYYQACGHCHPLVRELYPVMVSILDHHMRGTRFNIHQDQEDGLLYAGEDGLQLTWMDAKIGDWVVTPRIGKPVEINALWYNALRIGAEIGAALGKDTDARRFTREADRVYASFNDRFWYTGGYLYDVVDSPEGDDPTLRPNQIFAVSLPFPLLEGERARAVVDICARELVISYGLRSLPPDENEYIGHYGGEPADRDASYHQGTAWSWLLGPFVIAHYRAHGDAAAAYSYLEPMVDHLHDYGLGTIGELFDGDPAHAPRGCIAQAWGVGEILRAWHELRPVLQPHRATMQSFAG